MTKNSSIEILESRIAPAAGIVTVNLVGGNLIIKEDLLVIGANAITVSQVGPNEFAIASDAGTQIHDLISGATLTAGATDTIHGVITGNVTADLGTGADILNLSNIHVPGNLVVTDLDGVTVNLGNTKIGGQVQVKTGAGDDRVVFQNTFVTVGGLVNLQLGDGTNSFTSSATSLIVGSKINFTTGIGNDTFNLGGTNLDAAGILINAGSGANTNTIDPSHAHIGGGININNPNLNDVTPGSGTNSIFTDGDIAGSIAVTNGDGATNNTTVSAFSNQLKISGGVTVTGGSGSDTVNLNGGILKIAGSVKIIQNDGANHFSTSGRELDLGGALSVTSGSGDDQFGMSDNAINIAGGVTVNAGAGANTNFLSASNAMKIGGKVSITNTNSAIQIVSNTFNGSDFKIGGGIAIKNGDGQNLDTFNLTTFTDFGGLSIQGGTNIDNVTINATEFTVKGATTIVQGDIASNNFTLNATASELIGALVVKSGAGNDSVTFNEANSNFGVVLIDAGSGNNSVNFNVGNLVVQSGLKITNNNNAGESANTNFNGTFAQLKGAVSIFNGDGGSNTSFSSATTLISSFKFSSGFGADHVNMNGSDVQVKGSITLLTGAGNDTVDIDPTNLAVSGSITAALGAGNDTFDVTSEGIIKGSLISNKTGFSGNNLLTIDGSGAGPLRILGKLNLLGASSGGDVNNVNISDLAVAGATSISLGDGLTTIDINDIFAKGAFTILTGASVDSVNIETFNSIAESVFNSIAKITTGLGNDAVHIGGGTAAERAVFNGKLLLDGGGDNDTATGVLLGDAAPPLGMNALGNFFASGLPTVVNFETKS